MLASGLHISFGIFDLDIKAMQNQLIIKSSWYVGVAAHFLVEKWEKKGFYVSFIVNFIKNLIKIN